jgi:hypothetical protein
VWNAYSQSALTCSLSKCSLGIQLRELRKFTLLYLPGAYVYCFEVLIWSSIVTLEIISLIKLKEDNLRSKLLKKYNS